MGSNTDVVGFGDRGNLLGLHEAAAINNIRLNHMGSLAGQQVQKPEPAVSVLTGRDAQRRS